MTRIFIASDLSDEYRYNLVGIVRLAVTSVNNIVGKKTDDMRVLTFRYIGKVLHKNAT